MLSILQPQNVTTDAAAKNAEIVKIQERVRSLKAQGIYTHSIKHMNISTHYHILLSHAYFHSSTPSHHTTSTSRPFQVLIFITGKKNDAEEYEKKLAECNEQFKALMNPETSEVSKTTATRC